MSKSVTKGEARKSRQLEVRLATSEQEIRETLELRYNVFNLEMKEGLPRSSQTGQDQDEYDPFCDHLVVVDRERGEEIVGTYRILRGEVARTHLGFYSETEFDLSALESLHREMAEVGRSCVHPRYRDGSVISLLWSGIAGYLKEHSIRYLMGCASLHSMEAKLASETYSFLREKDHLSSPPLRVVPLASHHLDGFDPDLPLEDSARVRKAIPPLLKGYLRLGAKIGGHPALDPEFGTVDFFVLFDSNLVTSRYGNHYRRPG